MAKFVFDLPRDSGGAYWADGFDLGGLLGFVPASISATKIVWSVSNGTITDTLSLSGSGIVVQKSGDLIVDVTSGSLSGMTEQIVDTSGRVISVTFTNLNSDMSTFFTYVREARWDYLLSYLTRGSDQMLGSRAGDVLAGGGGKDALFGNGGNDILLGNYGDDRLSGGYGQDSLDGGVGTDTLFGGVGHDVLTGGSGRDQFVFNMAVRAEDSDVITDFTRGQDHIALSSKVIGGLGAAGVLDASHFVAGGATRADQVILYDANSGWVSYDSDGNGAAAAIALVQIKVGLDLHATDFLVL